MAASLRLTIDQQSAAALGSLSSSYGFVGVPARNAPACSAFCPPFPAFLCVLWLVLSLRTGSICGGKSAGSVVEVIYFVKRNSGVEGWGCWLWVSDVQQWWLCFRAGRRCCTEALSDVGINPSPILLGKLLGITVYLCIYYISLISASALRIADA
jgi:hypothetical protein